MSGSKAKSRRLFQTPLCLRGMACFCAALLTAPLLGSQAMDESIVSKHVQIRIPAEFQWLGRDTITDLERCWEFVEATTGGRLPKRVLVIVQWQDAVSSADPVRATLSVGMNDPSSSRNMREYFMLNAARAMARLAFMNLAGAGAAREDAKFLLAGMADMLAREFFNTVRRLRSAWLICHYLDRIQPLSLGQLAARPEFAGGPHDLRAAAPGVTFLTTCRDLYGRDRLLKLFESLARRSLADSIASVFKTPAAALEKQWLDRVRQFEPEEIILSDEEAPVLDRVRFVPESARPGTSLGMHLFTRDGLNPLTPSGIFVVDESSGKVFQGKRAGAAGSAFCAFEIPIDPARPEGKYQARVIAADEGGNVRIWETSYSVARQHDF